MLQRTDWAEEFVEAFVSLPLVHEWVFHAPSRMDRGIEKEVCDLLVSLRGDALLLQMKCQEDPGSRSDAKLASWVLKHADGALSQIKGAIRSVRTVGVCCDHPRRGKVSFNVGELRPVHGIVLVENWGDRVALPADLPLGHDGVPIAYFSVNDLLNVINELRAFPEILTYLQQRQALPEETLRAVGGESVLFLHYLQHGYTFDRWTSFEDAARETDRVSDPRPVILAARAGEEGAHLLEAVADALATRAADYLDGMPPDLAERFDAPTRRANYLRMQENICDVLLRERKLLGQQFWKVIHGLPSGSSPDMTFAAAYVDYKPDFLYIFAATRGIDRSVLLKRGIYALQCGLAHFGKSTGMFVADRGGERFEVVYLSGLKPTDEACAAGQKMFGHLKISNY